MSTGASHVNPKLSSNKLAIAACAMAVDAVNPAQPFVVVPAGEFRGLDGRPVELATGWICDDRNGPALADTLNKRNVDMVVDYDHQTLYVEKNGQKAIAAGWLKAGQFEYVPGVGIVNNQPSWTKAAANHLAEGEYRYRSPVLVYDSTGLVRDVINVALTNQPNLDVLSDVTLASLSQQYHNEPAANASSTQPQEDKRMDEIIEELRWMIGLPITATTEEILAQLDKLKSQIADTLKVNVAPNGQNLFDVISQADQKVAANSQSSVDPTQYVPIAVVKELQQELAESRAASEIEPLITAALSDGRLRGEHMERWARDIGSQKGAQELKATLDAIPKVAALSQKQTAVVAQGTSSAPDIDPLTVQISAQFGNDPNEVSKLL